MASGTLSCLTTEMLAQITTGSNLVLRLWACGNGLLNHKLKQGGSISVCLSESRLIAVPRWPVFLNAFEHLQSLSIDTVHSLNNV